MLGDLGADVLEIEDPAVGGDIARYVPPFRGERDSLYFSSCTVLLSRIAALRAAGVLGDAGPEAAAS